MSKTAKKLAAASEKIDRTKVYPVAAAIDAIKLKEIVGCIAGDDTIMLVLHSEADAIKTMENIKEAMEN